MGDLLMLRCGDLSALIDPRGAQLVSLRKGGVPYLYEGDAPQFWAKSAPLLFPVVGRCAQDRIFFEGTPYPMPRHGFARDQEFRVEGSALVLSASDVTRRHYPFEFRLEAEYRLTPHALECLYSVRNEDSRAMPFSFGLHPAFRWPLDGSPRESWRVRFPERMTLTRVVLEEGLRGPLVEPLIAKSDLLPLRDPLFQRDALVIPATLTRLALESTDSPRSVQLDFSPCSWLGIWSIPLAPFVCLEPWQGVAGRVGESGDSGGKEGMLTLPPGGRWSYRLSLTLK